MTKEMVLKLKTELEIDKGCVLITEAGNALACNDITICRGMLIYHHYRKLERDNEFFFHLIAATALDLSIQVCGQDVHTKDVITTLRDLGTQSRERFPYEALKEDLTEIQHDMYRVVFDRPYREKHSNDRHDKVFCETAHRYVPPYLKQFSCIPEVRRNLISVQSLTWRLLSTFYHCRKCVLYGPVDIARAALRLALSVFAIGVEDNRILAKELISTDCHLFEEMMVVSDISTEDINYSLA